jgi:hypothetical protein
MNLVIERNPNPRPFDITKSPSVGGYWRMRIRVNKRLAYCTYVYHTRHTNAYLCISPDSKEGMRFNRWAVSSSSEAIIHDLRLRWDDNRDVMREAVELLLSAARLSEAA